uniref:Glucosamine 6-phosphate N-acetyltransferase n=1 Tax=Myxobolus squamalis TaxID=59785 RepID=A0A6B2G3Z6_MYXSQ
MSESKILFDKIIIDNIIKSVVEYDGILKNRSYVVRPLSSDDFEKGYIELLGHLTVTGDINKTKYNERFNQMKSQSGYFIIVIEDTSTSKIIASSSLIVEMKFIHDCLNRGRVEDVVVHPDYRCQKLAFLLLKIIVKLAKQQNCYKLTLDARKEVHELYLKAGFALNYNDNLLEIRF